MLGKFIQMARTAVQRVPLVKSIAPTVIPIRSVEMMMASSMMGITSISNYHIYNLLRVLEKGQCLAENESELISSQSTLLAQGISLTNLISTVAKSSKVCPAM